MTRYGHITNCGPAAGSKSLEIGACQSQGDSRVIIPWIDDDSVSLGSAESKGPISDRVMRLHTVRRRSAHVGLSISSCMTEGPCSA